MDLFFLAEIFLHVEKTKIVLGVRGKFLRQSQLSTFSGGLKGAGAAWNFFYTQYIGLADSRSKLC
jgi:hypothetical protein